MCDDSWDINDAQVVCHQLGYDKADAYKISAYFGQGSTTSPVWLDDVTCSGSESRLEFCHHAGWDIENCNHVEDAGVVCCKFVAS